jgi:hypothetical protein
MPDGTAVLFDPRGQMAYPLTATAAIIWNSCDGAHTADAMVDALAASFDAPADLIERDVARLVRHLGEIGLLEKAPGTVE